MQSKKINRYFVKIFDREIEKVVYKMNLLQYRIYEINMKNTIYLTKYFI